MEEAVSPRKHRQQLGRDHTHGASTLLVAILAFFGISQIWQNHRALPSRKDIESAKEIALATGRLPASSPKETALATGRLPTNKEFLYSIPGLVPALLEMADDPCEWIERAGVDAFRGRCDFGAPVEGGDCGTACDTSENGKCRAWTRKGKMCFLKWCDDDAGQAPVILGATSAVRRNHTACAARRGWKIDGEDESRSRWLSAYPGVQTFLTHRRKPTDGETFGPIATIRGERHSGTNWVRAMIETNCPSLHHRLSQSLDSDGAYGWKHGMSPDNFSPTSKDALIIVVRSAASWVPKMKRVAYNGELDMHRSNTLSHYMRLTFVDNYSKTRYRNIVDLRSAKYRDYEALARRCPSNVVAVRYEDLVQDTAAFLFKALSRHIPACDASSFKAVLSYAKFGATAQNKHVEHVASWNKADWGILLSLLDGALEADLGYVYDRDKPGDCDVIQPPNRTWLLTSER